jgi:hypothetical protein
MRKCKKNRLLWEIEELRCVPINILRKCEACLELASRHLDAFKEQGVKFLASKEALNTGRLRTSYEVMSP